MTAIQEQPAAERGVACPTHAPRRASGGQRDAAGDVVDMRFRALVGDEAWQRLPEAVQKRFSKRMSPGDAIVYAGHVAETRLSTAGRLLANLARVIGAPLPLTDGATGAAVVVVTEEPALGGQTWTRCYARPGRFPQVVHSAKRFAGPTGLEEYVGAGISMALRVTVEEDALVFRSEQYCLDVLRRRFRIPSVFSPGSMEIVHKDLGGRAFSFRLTLRHARFGLLLDQLAHFRDS